MPVPRAAAAFEPIAPDLELPALVEATENFEYAVRLSCDVIDTHGIEQFEKLVLLHVVTGGKPLVIEGFQNRLDRWTFSTQWLRDNIGKKFEQARDLTKGEFLPLSINHYLDNMPMLTNQWTPQNYKMAKQRLYLKDIDCPELWQDKLREHIPPSLFYLNECSGEAPAQSNKNAAREFSRAGDLMSCLPPPMRAENMMCYIGHEGTYTPAHREMCASLGQNIMVEASSSVGEDGKPAKPGSSIWLMTESKDRHLVAEYWLSILGHDIEVESHFAQIDAWIKAPFKVYIVEQRPGDFILIPPLAPHQVWNRGTRTMKAAWNRTTVETLEMALSEALPRARMVCRDEQYKNKAVVLFSLNRYSSILKNIDYQKSISRDRETLVQLTSGTEIKKLQKDFKRLFKLYNDILLSETFSTEIHEKKVEYIPFDSNITCSYCRCNIFNRFLTCKNCIIKLDDGSEDTYDVCMECYAMGRSCRCISKLSWVEQFPWKDLLRKHENWRTQLQEIAKGVVSKSPIPNALDEERRNLDRKTLAEVCQEQLRMRPFQDPKKTLEPEEVSEEEDDVRDDGTRRKKPKKKRSEKWLRENLPCHFCGWRHPKWKMAVCECGVAFCYGSVWRGFDMMPQSIMEDPYWRCPKCREICNCRSCRTRPHNEPYQPSGTVLGHDTRKFADPRSIEALVDFSSSNAHWLKKAGDDASPTETRRMQRRIVEAEHAKSQQPVLDDEDDEESRVGEGGQEATEPAESPTTKYGRVPIDPLLFSDGAADDSTNLDAMGSQRVARDALSAMNGLSRLEQDPEAFIMQAQLDGAFNGYQKDMTVRKAANATSDGIFPSNMLTDGLNRTPSKANGRKGKQGRQKMAYKEKVNSEALLFANDANRRFYQSQAEKTMATAKKTGRLISARAAITGHRLIVKLQLSPTHLSRFSQSKGYAPPASATVETGLPDPQVQSDLPKNAPASPSTSKKRHRSEKDNEFGKGPGRGKRTMTDHHLISSGSEIDALSSDQEHEAIPANTRQTITDGSMRRSLPAYLARRSPVRDTDLPKELTATRRRKAAANKLGKVKKANGRTASRPPGSRPVGRPPKAMKSGSFQSQSDSKRQSSKGAEYDDGPNSMNVAEIGSRIATHISSPKHLGPSQQHATSPTFDELNRRAKIRAINGELSSSNYSDPDSEPDSLIALTPQRRANEHYASASRGSGKRNPGHQAGMAANQPQRRATAPPKMSILSKRRGGKVKIVSESRMNRRH